MSDAAMQVLFVLRPPVENYPPTLNQINILIEQGFQVSVLCAPSGALGQASDALPDAVRRVSIQSTPIGGGILGRLLGVLRFRWRVRQGLRRFAPRIVVACDAEAAWAVGIARRRGYRLVWHFHEVPERQNQGFSTNLANRWVWRHARHPDLIVFPDPGRAGVFAADAGIDVAAIPIVANCPRPLRDVPEPILRAQLAARLPAHARVVLYHGAIGPDHGIETAIRSMRHWPADACFVLKGRGSTEYLARIRALAEAEAVADRVLIHWPGFQSYEEHYRFIAGADVGWTALEEISAAWRYSAYASNKRFECMALGVPQVTNTGPLLDALVEANGCGLCVPVDDADAVGAAVHRLLSDPLRLAAMRAAGRDLHLREFHYDKQFEPVIKHFRQWLDCPAR